MQDAVPVGVGAMAAVLGLEAEPLAEVCREAAEDEVVAPANFNAPGQIVISGHAGAVKRAGDLAKARGAKRILPLDVSAPFHCELMQPAARRLAEALTEVSFSTPAFSVYANVNGRAYPAEQAAARELLVSQVCAPVRWEQCVQAMTVQGATHTLECGPGKVTSALVKRIAPSLTLLNIEKPGDLEAAAVAG
jgi:[acyl-carrier-protein] S-malonyltransferase